MNNYTDNNKKKGAPDTERNGRYVDLYESLVEKIASLKSGHSAKLQTAEADAPVQQISEPDTAEPEPKATAPHLKHLRESESDEPEPKATAPRPKRLRESDSDEPEPQATAPQLKHLRESDSDEPELPAANPRPKRLCESESDEPEPPAANPRPKRLRKSESNKPEPQASNQRPKRLRKSDSKKPDNSAGSSPAEEEETEIDIQTYAKRTRTGCPATPTAPVPEMKAGYAPAFLFAGFILLIAIWFIIAPKESYSPSEKRILSEFPKTDAESVFSGEFGKNFETYFADHFPARNMWVGVNAYTNLVEGNNGANGVYKCDDGYLINKPVSTDNKINDNLEMLLDFKTDIGNVPMAALFVPSTGYIMDDKLPMIHDSYNDDLYFDNIAQTLRLGSIRFVDLREDFKNAAQNGTQLYYRTDHHWTTEGAYTAYCRYCDMFGLDATPRSDFQIEKHGNFYGTTYSKSGFWFTEPDTVEVWKNPADDENAINVLVSDMKPPYKEQNSMFFYEHENEDDKYPIFLDGNHAETIITNENASGGTIIVIKDSFSHCFAPFLADNYKKVILVDLRYFNQDVTQMIQEEDPEQVLVLYGIDNFADDSNIGHLWG